MIPFNKPYLTGKEAHYMYQAVSSGKISGNGDYTKKCHEFFESQYDFKKCLLTTSCTDALEMAAILINIQPGDEVIIPSFTFVSSANAFILRGANVIFADSRSDEPNLNIDDLEKLINNKTKAIVPVHYAGVACDMDALMQLAARHNLFVVEDAAQAIDSYFHNKPLGGIGHLAAFSFHETKNVISGEGGMLVINDDQFMDRSEIIWEKGTNRSAFWRGEVDKYGWMDVGSSFLPSEITAAFLFAQLENLDEIQKRRKEIWHFYYNSLKPLRDAGKVRLPFIPSYATNNAHMFYVICSDYEERTSLIDFMKKNEIHTVFHYLSLHKSQFYKNQYHGENLPNADMYSDCVVRLPFYYELKKQDQNKIIKAIHQFYDNLKSKF